MPFVRNHWPELHAWLFHRPHFDCVCSPALPGPVPSLLIRMADINQKAAPGKGAALVHVSALKHNDIGCGRCIRTLSAVASPFQEWEAWPFPTVPYRSRAMELGSL